MWKAIKYSGGLSHSNTSRKELILIFASLLHVSILRRIRMQSKRIHTHTHLNLYLFSILFCSQFASTSPPFRQWWNTIFNLVCHIIGSVTVFLIWIVICNIRYTTIHSRMRKRFPTKHRLCMLCGGMTRYGQPVYAVRGDKQMLDKERTKFCLCSSREE